MKKPPLDVQGASRLARKVRLNDIQCIALGVGYVFDGEVPPDLSLSWKLAPVSASWMRTERSILAVFPFVVHIDGKRPAVDEKDDPEPEKGVRIAEAQVMLRLEYTLAPGIDVVDAEVDMDDFVGVNGYLHAWPYLRAEVQSLTTKIGLPPLLLPVQLSGHAARTVTVSRASELPAGGLLAAPSSSDTH
jgi:hypothetical protein